VDVVWPEGAAVLNAADPMVAKMAELCDGEVIFFAADPAAPALAGAKRAVFARDGQLVLSVGGQETLLAPVSAVPLAAREGGVESVLAGVGAAWALGISPDLIRAGIETFELA
jgi:cyanophycin synthetase